MPPSRTKSKPHSASSPSSDDSPATFKKESSLKDLKDDKLKRKRQSQSCDACRARKVRCARPDTPDADGDATASESTGGMTIVTTTGPDGKKEVAQCKHCIALGIKCTYDYQPKKRGPPNLYLRRLQEAAAAAAQQGQDSSGSPTSTGLVSHTSALSINSPGGLNGYGLNNTGSSPVVPSHRMNESKSQTNGYFVNGAANAGNGHTQMVVPSQGYQQQHQHQSPEFSHNGTGNSNGYHQTHSFMDTNTISSVNSSSSGAVGNNGLPNLPTLPTLPALPNLPSLSMPSLPNLPSLPSLPMWQSSSPAASISSETHTMSGVLHHNGYSQNGQSMSNPLAPQVLTTPMHLQPSPARLSPVSASLSLSHHHQAALNGINGNGPLPPSRYPIAADMNGIGRPSSSSGSTSETKTPTQVPTLDPRMGSPHIDPSKSVIGQRYVHHYTSTSGSLPAFVHSRPTSPANGQSSHNDDASAQANNCMSLHPNGNDMVPLTPATAAEIFPQYPMYNWSMPYKSLDHQAHSNSESGADVFGGGVANANANVSALTASSPTLLSSSAAAAVSASASASLIHPPLAQFHRPHSLETIAPLPTVMHILSLFFDFVYPLTPCIHKPSFYQGLMEKREERDPLFFALVCSTVASTLVQVPRSYLPMERDEVRKLAKRFSEASRLVTVASYDPPCSAMVVIRYLDTVYHFCEGHDATSHAAFGEAAHIAVTLHMHEEASYEGLDYIESEIRRRAFWLLFDADKSMSILLGRPICLRDEDCTLHFPREVDDEYITQHTIHPQPPHKTAIVSGLNYISRIFALLGEILVRIRVDKRCPPQGPFAIARLEEVRALHTRICNALAHTPPELRLKPASSSAHKSSVPSSASSTAGSTASTDSGTRVEYGGAGFTKTTFAEIKEFFDNPNASRENASNPFLVMQANLYVTQQLVRFVIEQYRDELITSMRDSGVDFTAHGSVAVELARGNWTSDDREAVASDLLTVLHSIPIQSIATNGPSLVHKVRFVASTLLDAVRKAETAPASAARAHAYLWDFLSILSEIERNYLLADDREEYDA